MSFGGEPLFTGINLSVEPGERVCLIGRNGTGKSTLLALLAGAEQPTAGTVSTPPGIRCSFLPQDLPADLRGPIRLLDGIAGSDQRPTVEAARALTQLGIDPDRRVEELSGGELRRVVLARTLAVDWDVLLLDEPTNHLDIDSIEWLQSLLVRETRSRSLVFVSHDRQFSSDLATRVVALDRARLYSFPGSYDRFVERQQAALATEQAQEAAFDRKLGEEEAWLRRGIKARRTRNEGRVRRLQEMRAAYAARRRSVGTARMRISEAERSGDLIAELEDVSFAWPERPILRSLSTRILAGDRLGIVGPNGAGKTTLLRLILGSLEPDGGRIRRGTGLQVVYFDQRRAALDGSQRLFDAVGDGYDTVEVGGHRRHVLAYMQDFLFSEDDRNRPVGTLSGGEQSRLVLARLFARPSNVLVLDEPTNDLDQETLELLEDLLVEYAGTVLMVSHDRRFMDNVITDALLLDGAGGVEEHAGSSQDWIEAYHRMRTEAGPTDDRSSRTGARAPGSAPAPSEEHRRQRARRLGFREREELDQLPGRIEALEAEQNEVSAALADPELYRSDDGSRTRELTERLSAIETELEQAFERWDELSTIAEADP